MPLIKIGTKTVGEAVLPIYLLQGNATRDGEQKEVGGKDLGKVSVAANELKDGSSLFVTLNGWRGRAASVAAVRKMDSVLAVGTLKERMHNERKYWDMDVDFIVTSGVGSSGATSAYDDFSPSYGGESVGFEDISGDEDGELPF